MVERLIDDPTLPALAALDRALTALGLGGEAETRALLSALRRAAPLRLPVDARPVRRGWRRSRGADADAARPGPVAEDRIEVRAVEAHRDGEVVVVSGRLTYEIESSPALAADTEVAGTFVARRSDGEAGWQATITPVSSRRVGGR